MKLPALISLMLLGGLAACSGRIVPPSVSSPPRTASVPVPPPATSPPVKPTVPIAPAPAAPGAGPNARKAGVVAGPTFADLRIDQAGAARALQAFRVSCPTLVRRSDVSGLTAPGDWAASCAAAATWDVKDAAGFFASQFDVAQVGDGKAFATGYYEPEIKASRTRAPGYDVPIYRRPADLIEADLGDFAADLKGRKLRGRVTGQSLVPYYDRGAIEDGALAGRGLELAWAADAADFFVLQVQGSGRLRLPDGGVIRIGYDSQNGRDYTGIGRVMRERGLLAPGKATMGDIVDYIHANPEQGRLLMRENKSWVFFREQTGAGPLGALGYPVTPRGSVAADPAFVPLGAPVVLSMDRAEPNGLWIAQDTGGAIKGSNRFDTFWGAGEEAARIAGGMSARGTAFLLLPKGVVARLTAPVDVAAPAP